MIDWGNVAANTLWIVGCTLGLTAVSYARWEAMAEREKLGVRLRQPKMHFAVSLAGGLFSLGLAVTFRSALETALWSLLTVLFCTQICGLIVAGKQR
ncbi:MAG: hypothetical protein ACYTEQ_06900 [Planctomycetota bacterium]|jgi:hypothetical protein